MKTHHALSRDIPAAAVRKTLDAQARDPLFEIWSLKLNDIDGQYGFWIRFTVLVSANGFRRIAETWATLFERRPGGEVDKISLKQGYDLSNFSLSEDRLQVSVGSNILSPDACRGEIRSKNRTLSWNLRIEEPYALQFDYIPSSLTRLGLIRQTAEAESEHLLVSGSCKIDGREVTFMRAPGMRGHFSGTRLNHSWSWSHCNAFTDGEGNPADLVFDGITCRGRVFGGLKTPPISTFLFRYGGTTYAFNSAWDAIRATSEPSLAGWTFRADRGDLSFRGELKSNLRDFAGHVIEDTDGTYLYCSSTELADMTLLIYRGGKLEASYAAKGTAGYEIASREKNPYVPMLV